MASKTALPGWLYRMIKQIERRPPVASEKSDLPAMFKEVDAALQDNAHRLSGLALVRTVNARETLRKIAGMWRGEALLIGSALIGYSTAERASVLRALEEKPMTEPKDAAARALRKAHGDITMLYICGSTRNHKKAHAALDEAVMAARAETTERMCRWRVASDAARKEGK